MADTAAIFFLEEGNTDQYIHIAIPIKKEEITNNGINILLTNKETMKLTCTCNLDIPELPKQATHVYIFKELASGSLLSI